MPRRAIKAGAPGSATAGGKDELFRHYSAKAVDHMLHPRNMRRISRPSGYARVASGESESLEVFLELEGEIVSACAFETDGCAATLACASAATGLVRGKPLSRLASSVTAEAILRALDGLPPGNAHCAELVADAFRAAVRDALGQKGQPWKRMYRNT